MPNSEDSLAPPVDPCRAVFPRIQCDWRLPSSLSEGVLYDCVEIFRGTGNWSHAHCRHGLRVHDGFDVDGRRARIADLSDPAVARELVALALRGVVREWHAGVPCVSFGTLRRPRVRSRLIPYGFNPNMLARRTAFVLCIAVRRGQYVSVEQPAGSCLYHLACYKVLVGLGCIVTTFCYCSFGSPFLKRSRWLHNKPWLCSLEGGCRCRYKKQHFVVQGSFDADSLSEFQRRCIPSVRQVYGVEPLVGQSVASYSGAYPLGLVDRMASGSVHALEGFRGVIAPEHHARTEKFLGVAPSSSWPLWFADEEPFEPRPDHEDPEWVKELCQSLSFREVFRYRFKRPGHINVNESRVFKSWIKSLARKTSSTRCVGLLDSRVAIGAAAKGRSSSFAISRVLQGCLGYVLGSGLYPGLLHCYSEDNVADAPSRGHSVKPPRRQVPQWLAELMSGKALSLLPASSGSQVVGYGYCCFSLVTSRLTQAPWSAANLADLWTLVSVSRRVQLYACRNACKPSSTGCELTCGWSPPKSTLRLLQLQRPYEAMVCICTHPGCQDISWFTLSLLFRMFIRGTGTSCLKPGRWTESGRSWNQELAGRCFRSQL